MEWNPRSMGAKGGKTTSEKYGHEFFVGIGRKGGSKVSSVYGHEHFVGIGYKAAAAKAAKNQALLDRISELEQELAKYEELQ